MTLTYKNGTKWPTTSWVVTLYLTDFIPLSASYWFVLVLKRSDRMHKRTFLARQPIVAALASICTLKSQLLPSECIPCSIIVLQLVLIMDGTVYCDNYLICDCFNESSAFRDSIIIVIDGSRKIAKSASFTSIFKQCFFITQINK